MNMYIAKCIKITSEQKQFIEDMSWNFSKFVRKAIEKERNESK